MIVRTTEKVRGEIVLPTLSGVSIKPGQQFNVDQSKFYEADIQGALKLGFLIIEEQGEFSEDSSRIKIRNLSKKNVNFTTGVKESINLSPGESMFVTNDQVSDDLIQRLISANVLSVETEAIVLKDYQKNTEKKATEAKIATKEKKETVIEEEAVQDNSQKTNIGAWDAQEQTMLSQEESKKKVQKQYAQTEVDVMGDMKKAAKKGKKAGRPKKKSLDTLINMIDLEPKENTENTAAAKAVSKKSTKTNPLVEEKTHEGPALVFDNSGKELEFIDDAAKKPIQNNTEIE